MNQNYTVKLYECKACKATMMAEEWQAKTVLYRYNVFADETNWNDMMKQNPYCNECGVKVTNIK